MQRPKPRHTLSKAMTTGGLALLAASCLPGAQDGLFLDGVEMESFSSCRDLESSIKRRATRQAEMRAFSAVTGGLFNPSGFGNEGSRNFSDTNTQESGVDEADLLKVDGRFAYAVHHGKLVIVEAHGSGSGASFAIASAGLMAELDIEGAPFELYIHGDRALVLARTDRQEVKALFGAEAPDRPEESPVFKAVLVDITDRAQPRIMRELLLEGDFVSSRRIEDKAYLVVKTDLKGNLDQDSNPSEESWLERRRAEIKGAGIDAWMPSYYDVRHRADGRPLKKVQRCSCSDTFASPEGAGDGTLTVYAVDLDQGESDLANTTILGDGAHVYASERNVFVAMASYAEDKPGFALDDEDIFEEEDGGQEGGTRQVTHLHRFDIRPDGTVGYNASGRVDGWILNAFSMSEHLGVLRVATQVGERGSAEAESNVFTLKLSSKNKELMAVGGDQPRFLKTIGELRGIAPGEDMYAARFVGARGFLVTFQEVDPLWNIDLSDPERPTIKGDLEVPGFSTYLHPIENNRLLAVGRTGTGGALKLSLFDVGKADPSVIHEKEVGNGNSRSEAAEDHRAFRYIPERRMMAIPMVHDAANGLQLYSVDNRSGIRFAGRITHEGMVQGGDRTVRRSQLIGDHLFALSGVGLSITDLDSMETVAEIDLEDE